MAQLARLPAQRLHEAGVLLALSRVCLFSALLMVVHAVPWLGLRLGRQPNIRSVMPSATESSRFFPTPPTPSHTYWSRMGLAGMNPLCCRPLVALRRGAAPTLWDHCCHRLERVEHQRIALEGLDSQALLGAV